MEEVEQQHEQQPGDAMSSISSGSNNGIEMDGT